MQQLSEVQAMQEELSSAKEEHTQTSKMIMEEVTRTRQQEQKCKKLYQDTLFYKELIQK